jgi:hypothetical protein
MEQRLASLAQPIANLNAAVASQTRRIDELTSRVAELEAKQSLVPIAELPHTPLYTTPVDRQEPHTVQPQIRTTEPSRVTVPAHLPPGTLHSTDFAAQLGLSKTVMEGMLKNGVKGEQLERIKIPSTSKGERNSNYFSPEQQEQAIELLKKHSKL